jgi:hypothetical protein
MGGRKAGEGGEGGERWWEGARWEGKVGGEKRGGDGEDMKYRVEEGGSG